MCTGKQFLHVHGVGLKRRTWDVRDQIELLSILILQSNLGERSSAAAISISHLRNINRAGADESRIGRRHFIFAYIMIVCMIVRQVFELPPCMLTCGRSTILLSVSPLSSNRLLVAVLMQRIKAVLFAT